MSEAAQLDQARRLFRAFHGVDAAQPDDIVRVGGLEVPELALVVGRIVGLGYKNASDGVDYFHKFDASNRPLLYVNSDGRQLYALRGAYRFTERGFVG